MTTQTATRPMTAQEADQQCIRLAAAFVIGYPLKRSGGWVVEIDDLQGHRILENINDVDDEIEAQTCDVCGGEAQQDCTACYGGNTHYNDLCDVCGGTGIMSYCRECGAGE